MKRSGSSSRRLVALGIGVLGATVALGVLSAMTTAHGGTSIDRLAIAARQRGATRVTYPADHLPLLTLPGGRHEVVRSVLNVGRELRYGDYVWDDTDVAQGPLVIRVDLSRQLLSVFRGGHEIGTALVLFGAQGRETPRGLLTIMEKDENHYSRSYDAPMAYMLRLTGDGVAIHASDVRAAAATHGCIGVPTGFARRLFAAAKVGDPVAVLGPAVDPQQHKAGMT